ncbi:ADP-ribosylation [Thelephora ganbajun]|uniref:ADP-ribosylation n=1 Tax=Thelephora ganbajun TaxID=370292 RepID=A0ACB6Z437_THEGA|nr:ADP-ribosylation [Thelephora ganbajun]
MSGICATPGCSRAVYRDANGKAGKYCRQTHRSWGEKGCISCRRAEKFGESKFCFPCEEHLKTVAPGLVLVPRDNETYHNVANQFQRSWRHPTLCPKIRAIYKIVERPEIMDRYNVYRNAVEFRGGFTAKGITSGNQQRRWHGTNRGCRVGESGQTTLCYSPQCALCSIIRTSFDIAHSKKKTGWGRFGNGIYTSSTSSKSNDYSNNIVSSPWKAVLLAYVAVGRAKTFETDQPTLTQPPNGYDSVIGEPSPMGSLNYDELVVYTNDAVRPAYLVMYGS